MATKVTPAVPSTSSENANPFSALNAVTTSLNLVGVPKVVSELNAHSPPPTPRKYQTTRADRHLTPVRIQRKKSRSSSRRPDSDARLSNGSFNETWSIESNPHCNVGLKNAVQSVGDKLRKKLWVGTLGTNTDSFKDPLRRIIDQKMLEQCDSVPIWIPDAEFESCYDEFCHQVGTTIYLVAPSLTRRLRYFGLAYIIPFLMCPGQSYSMNQLPSNST